MKTILFFFVSVLITITVSAQTPTLTQTIRGIVTDEQSNHPLHGVSVSVQGLKSVIFSISDSLGNFKLKNVPIGRQSIKISFVGFEESSLQNIELTSSKEVVLEIKLKEKVKLLNRRACNHAQYQYTQELRFYYQRFPRAIWKCGSRSF